MMRHFWRAGLCGLVLTAAGAEEKPIPPQISVEDFARAPQFSDPALSPDGAYIGYIVRKDESSGVGFLNLATDKAEVLWARRDRAFHLRNEVGTFEWVGNRRALLSASMGWVGVDADLGRVRYLTGLGRWVEEHGGQYMDHTPNIFAPDGVIHAKRYDTKNLLVSVAPAFVGERRRHPDVFRLDTETGAFAPLMKNPGNVDTWLADWNGEVRFGLITDGVDSSLIFRRRADQPWSAPIPFGKDTLSYGFAGPAGDETLYLFKPAANGRKALFAHNLATGETTGPLFQHEKYDVAEAIFSPKHQRLLGVRYVTEGPRQYWFEPELAKLQKELDAAHPGVVNMIVSMDWEMQRLLVFSSSSRESGYYTLLNLATHKSRLIAVARPWLKPEDMAEMHPVKCAARDGLELNGYLTLPPGHGQKNLPTVVLVHGGPYGTRDQWGFDPLVQFLANRGYAVLQVNYRGSGGYGEVFHLKGRGQIGAKIEEDVEDMTRWAVKQGFADPRRLAIMGASYGGYSTLATLARTPNLFRCGVTCMAVANWASLFKDLEDDGLAESVRWWRTQIADMENPEEKKRLAAISPVNLATRITVPVFIMHGEDDGRVPIRQAHAMVSALKKAGRPPETLFLEQVGHWWPVDQKGAEFLTKLEAFLAANLKAN